MIFYCKYSEEFPTNNQLGSDIIKQLYEYELKVYLINHLYLFLIVQQCNLLYGSFKKVTILLWQ
jgi:hypothetical protein